jgi:hypothetical protein
MDFLDAAWANLSKPLFINELKIKITAMTYVPLDRDRRYLALSYSSKFSSIESNLISSSFYYVKLNMPYNYKLL